MPDCLIVAASAEELAEEIARLADFPIAIKACTSSEQALLEYTDESVVFGNPDMNRYTHEIDINCICSTP